MMDDFEFTMDAASPNRNAYRTRIPGLEASLVGAGEAYPISDLSATGLSYLDPGRRHGRGEVLQLDLTIAKRIFLEDVTAKVMRVTDDGVTGVAFEGLTRQKELRLDKLILEAQKRLIAQRKKTENQNGKSE
ncbi:MAG: PilZ domain-containing protein [Desulfovibrionaceae bacterium]|nr:PilZ domain-containing protein [Desulfovibrionaceae bacterium]MBF0513182.1 PilZ domain-containing protein [Desulfovibrionaceae bacterium]